MAAAAKPRPGAGSGLNKKIAGVPAKYLAAAAILIVAYLAYRHFKGSQSTSAGSNATPAPSSTLPVAQGDSTGGGGSGSIGDSGAAPNPTLTAAPQVPPIYLFGLGNTPPAGGNTSPPAAAASSQPVTSFTSQLSLTPAGTTSYGGYEPAISAGTTVPKTATAPYTTTITANKTGGSATKKQGVITVH
jgi:hypothetical protein